MERYNSDCKFLDDVIKQELQEDGNIFFQLIIPVTFECNRKYILYYIQVVSQLFIEGVFRG